jgi:hypothetical protein
MCIYLPVKLPSVNIVSQCLLPVNPTNKFEDVFFENMVNYNLYDTFAIC